MQHVYFLIGQTVLIQILKTFENDAVQISNKKQNHL